MQNIVEYVLNLKGNLSQGLTDATNHANKLENSLGGVKSAAMSLGSVLGVTFGVAGIAMFISKTVQAGTVVEDAMTGLTTLLKDQQAAAEVIKNTMEDAKRTPFEFKGLLAANKALISADESAENARKAVLNLANAISATGGGNDELTRMVVNLQQIKNVGFASALDIKQFAYAGINIHKALAEAGIKTGEGIRITYAQITKALEVAHAEGGIYFHGLENMANNTSVKLSNVGDALFQMMNDIFIEIKPLVDGVLNGILTGITKIQEYIKPIKAFIVGIINDTGGWADYINMVKDLFMNYVLPYVEKIFYATTDIAKSIWTFVQHSYLLKNSFQSLMTFAKAVFQIIGYVVDAISWVWKNAVLPIANAIENIYRFVTGMSNTKIEAEIKMSNESSGVKATKTGQPSLLDEVKVVGKNGGKVTSNESIAEPKTKAEGQKNINIHVAYNAPLISGFTISTTNINEGIDSLKEKISAILVGATHDSLMVADY